MNSSNGQGSPIMLCSSSFTGQPLHDTDASKVVSSIYAKTYFACVHQRCIGRFGIRHGGFCQRNQIVNLLGKLATSVYEVDRQRFSNF
mgnify:CR=1 FL=1|jgi:hypothetical protein